MQSQAGAIDALLSLSLELEFQAVAHVALFSLGNLLAYDVCRSHMEKATIPLETTLRQLHKMAESRNDSTALKYVSRVLDKLGKPPLQGA